VDLNIGREEQTQSKIQDLCHKQAESIKKSQTTIMLKTIFSGTSHLLELYFVIVLRRLVFNTNKREVAKVGLYTSLMLNIAICSTRYNHYARCAPLQYLGAMNELGDPVDAINSSGRKPGISNDTYSSRGVCVDELGPIREVRWGTVCLSQVGSKPNRSGSRCSKESAEKVDR
jgi:hypothetical protein